MPAGTPADPCAQYSVILVSMPFMNVRTPSIQLGLLKSLAITSGFPVRAIYANLIFASQIGTRLYQLLAEHRGRLIGEWLFSLEAFGEEAPDQNSRMLEELAVDLPEDGGSQEDLWKKLTWIRKVEVPTYLDSLLDAFAWQQARVVGFTSTFQQNAASFALARRLKKRYPHIFTLFGGANFDGDMGPELVRTIDCIDAAVIGEGDEVFPRLLAALAAGGDLSGIPGVAFRQDGRVIVTPPQLVRQLDDAPVPDYGEYFEFAESTGILPRTGQRKLWLPIETSRGCWWGVKHHCTFCGLNATGMSFRSKSPQRVLAELAEQTRRYRSFHFAAVDNILDMSYLTDLCPLLVESKTDYKLFYEVKANLTREQVRLLARAGVTSIQPGIESLSSHVLCLMRKGVRAIQNVNLLRWCRYYDLQVSWNLLWGFPGETEQDYARQAAVIPHLVHLPPPTAADRIWLERFSPLFTGQDGYQVRDRSPERSYQYIYPEYVDLDRIAYFFEYQIADSLPDDAYSGVRDAVDSWSQAWLAERRPTLTYWSAPHFVQITDRRHPGQGGTYTFEDTLADMYLACVNRPTSGSAVRRKLCLPLPVEAIKEVFEEFQRRGLMFLDDQFALALALPAVAGR